MAVKILPIVASAVLGLSLSSPAFAAPKAPELAPMQIQAMQQREFEAPKSVVFASVMDVLQDLGFTIGSADVTTGFLTAESPTARTKSMCDLLWYGGATANTRVTAFVEELANGKTKVRLNFVSRKTRANTWTYQQENHDKAVVEPRVYQMTFEKVDEALFVRRAVNTPGPAAAPATSH